MDCLGSVCHDEWLNPCGRLCWRLAGKDVPQASLYISSMFQPHPEIHVCWPLHMEEPSNANNRFEALQHSSCLGVNFECVGISLWCHCSFTTKEYFNCPVLLRLWYQNLLETAVHRTAITLLVISRWALANSRNFYRVSFLPIVRSLTQALNCAEHDLGRRHRGSFSLAEGASTQRY